MITNYHNPVAITFGAGALAGSSFFFRKTNNHL
jgi:hypothetical protein